VEFTIEKLSKRADDIQTAADEIVERYYEIKSLQDAAVWKSDALAIQNVLTLFQADLVQFHNSELESLQKKENTRKNLPFVQRFTASRESEKKHKNNLDILQKGMESVKVAKSVINETIDETPTNKVDLKTMLSGLITRKKELTFEKRSQNEEMRQIRTKARQDRANLSGMNRGTMGKIATYQRAAITREKESKLSPLEYKKGEIEYELIEIDKKINRLNGFKGDDMVYIETKVRRCSYCGRRVNSGELCPGCGSDRTTYELN
jgi:rubrerythrin